MAGDVLSAEGVEEGAGVNRMSTHEIVPPEPHSQGPDLQKTRAHLPRWLQVGLVVIILAAAAFAFLFVK